MVKKNGYAPDRIPMLIQMIRTMVMTIMDAM